ncbi:MAG: pyridoxamine 5'-phosphate oxidase [bacterium]|jgi:pyridoxamine 5'-phosphate oxidase
MIEQKSQFDETVAEEELRESEMDSDPIVEFTNWFALAESQISEANAMTLATASREGKPSARMVLLKGVDERGFTFFTNFSSRKSQELEENPCAALVFWWKELRRQVRIEGRVERVAEQESDAYFRSRPRGSQLGALASPQSLVVPDRQVLERTYQELEEKYEGQEIPRPTHWGGYRLVPERIEFWLSRRNRLHDRICYQKEQGGWSLERLAP